MTTRGLANITNLGTRFRASSGRGGIDVGSIGSNAGGALNLSAAANAPNLGRGDAVRAGRSGIYVICGGADSGIALDLDATRLTADNAVGDSHRRNSQRCYHCHYDFLAHLGFSADDITSK